MNIDPAWSRQAVVPPADHWPLCNDPAADEAAWLYLPGDLEAYLMSRVRYEGYRDSLRVYHPGLFRGFATVAKFQYKLQLKRRPSRCSVTIGHTGVLHMEVNGAVAAHLDTPHDPASAMVDLRPHLKVGENNIVICVATLDVPPALYIDSPVLRTDSRWECSRDMLRFSPANRVLPAAGGTAPHHSRLPSLTLRPTLGIDGLYDFGVELLARPVVQTSVTAQVTVAPGETPEEARNTNLQTQEQVVDTLTVSAGQPATGRLMAMRYLRLESSVAGSVQDVFALAEFHPAAYRGAFACSDDRLTRIWMHSAYTLRLCMREFFLDGLKRDRMPWVGDLFLSILCNAVSFADANVVKRSLVASAPDDAGRCQVNGIVDYTLYWLISVERYASLWGDLDFARQWWPLVQRVLGWLRQSEDARGLLMPKAGDWVFIDWAEMDKKGAVAAIQMLYAMAMESAASLALLCGDGSTAVEHTSRRKALVKTVRVAFWSERQGAFVDAIRGGRRSSHVSRPANALAVVGGVADVRQQKLLCQNVLQGAKVAPVGTPYMGFFECLALAKLGRQQQMVQHIRSYWGGMLDQGATSFWEGFDLSHRQAEHTAFYGRAFGKSLCHAWAAGPVYLLSTGLFGLRVLEPGWKSLEVSPTQTDLEWACAVWPTPSGDVRVEMDRGRLSVKAPKGVRVRAADR